MKDKESDLVLDDIMGEVADSAASFLLDQPPKMSDEDTDYVLDEHTSWVRWCCLSPRFPPLPWSGLP